MHLSRKTRIYPTSLQKKLIEQSFGVSRFTYNRGLALWKEKYEQFKSSGSSDKSLPPSWSNVRNDIVALKKQEEFSWLKDVPSGVIKTTCSTSLKNAFNNFFSKKAKYPKFKSKHSSKQSFSLEKETDSSFKLDKMKRRLRIQKIGFIKMAESFNINDSDIKYITISRKCNKYYISITYNVKCTHSSGKLKVGLDVGVKTLCQTSIKYKSGNYMKISFPKTLLKLLDKRLRRLQKILARSLKGSKRRERLKAKISNLYNRIQNIKLDIIHKFTTKVIKLSNMICIEDLSIKNMLKNKKLSRAIHESDLYKFLSILEYKCKIYGVELYQADKFYPSSKTCSHCGSIKKELKLSERVYRCEKCSIEIDRDINAALNLKNLLLTQ